MAESNVVVGLDIGTTKILCLVAEVSGPGDVEIIGVSSHPSTRNRSQYRKYSAIH